MESIYWEIRNILPMSQFDKNGNINNNYLAIKI